MAQTNFKVFNEDMSPDRTFNDSEYNLATQRQGGVIPGMALSRMHNKLYRQTSAMAAAIANFLVEQGCDAMDNNIQGITEGIRTAVEGIVQEQTADIEANLLKRNTDYASGDIAYSPLLPSYAYVECTAAGTTSETEPVWPGIGGVIADGTATWKVIDIRQGTSIGRVPALVDVGDGTVGLPAVSGRLLKEIPAVTARNTVLTGPLSLRGAAMALRDKYSENLCIAGTPISGGDAAGYSKEIFSAAGGWCAVQIGDAVNATAYIGYALAIAKHVRKLYFSQSSNPSAVVSSIKVQNSADGLAWTDVGTFAVYTGINIIELPASSAKRYWRILANSGAQAGWLWGVHQIHMYELLDPGLADNEIQLLASTQIAFASGDKDYREKLNAAIKVALPAADAYTIPIAYTGDLCNGGTAISGGDSSIYVASRAFNNDATTSWQSAQSSGHSGVSYIGYNFISKKTIRRIRLINHESVPSNMPSVRIQSSSDGGGTWTTSCTVTLNTAARAINDIDIPVAVSAQSLRLLANANLEAGNYWIVPEIEMYEALQTYYLLADRNPGTGTISLVAAKQKPRVQTEPSDYYTDNLCVGVAAISSGTNTGYPANVAANALDNNATTSWSSLQEGNGISGVAFIGCDFGVQRAIEKIILNQALDGISSVKAQRSTDGVAWTDAQTFATVGGINELVLTTSTPARYWRLLANSNRISGATGPGSSWDVAEITMHELATNLIWYNPMTGKTQLANAGSWVEIQRVPAGEAVVNSDGKIVSYKTYDYGRATLLIPPGIENSMPVNLGQFVVTENTFTIPTPGTQNPILVQFFTATVTSASSTVPTIINYPKEFKEKVIAAVVTDVTGGGWARMQANYTALIRKSSLRVYTETGATVPRDISIIAIGR